MPFPLPVGCRVEFDKTIAVRLDSFGMVREVEMTATQSKDGFSCRESLTFFTTPLKETLPDNTQVLRQRTLGLTRPDLVSLNSLIRTILDRFEADVGRGGAFSYDGETVEVTIGEDTTLSTIRVTAVESKDGFRERKSLTYHMERQPPRPNGAIPPMMNLTDTQRTVLLNITTLLRNMYEQATASIL